MSEKFNFEEALKTLQSGQAITGKDGCLCSLASLDHASGCSGKTLHSSAPDSLSDSGSALLISQ